MTLDKEALRSTFLATNPTGPAAMSYCLALAREAAARSLGLSPYPVQLMAAAILFEGVIAEMKTGEGKTLSIALAASIASRMHKSVHIATPNPYLAARDCEAMRPLYEYLGLKVGVTLPGQSILEKQTAYAANVTYGVHSEFGFDYLRDHLALEAGTRVQGNLEFVIVDEADSILIDEARTPLIISESTSDSLDLVILIDGIVRMLDSKTDIAVDQKERTAYLTEQGFEHIGALLTARGLIASEKALYTEAHLSLMRLIDAALRAHFIYRRDHDYVLRNGKVLIVDEATGRTLFGRRWQGGVHQAVEAAEKLPIQAESRTIAEITYQSYFGLYRQLSGLTGTALSAAKEFKQVYGRNTLEIPTNVPCIRKDLPDLIFANRREKFNAIVDETYLRHQQGQPVLIGTGSVSESEALSHWLNWAGLPHRVLNARQNADEAAIIAEAGMPGAITITTNMAGRGTDIVLGGHPNDQEAWQYLHAQVLKSGGLHIIGTQRHESRRIDDQLRGRAGRQGDPGSSQFFLSLDDDLIRIFGARQFGTLGKLIGHSQGKGVTSPILARIVRKAQQSLEDRNFAARQDLFRFDDVIARQRDVVYALRQALIDGPATAEILQNIFQHVLTRLIDSYIKESHQDISALKTALEGLYAIHCPALKDTDPGEHFISHFKARILNEALTALQSRRADTNVALTEEERRILLNAIDHAWHEHLTYLDALKEGINLRGFAQESPIHAFAIEAYRAFEQFTQAYENAAALLLAGTKPSEPQSVKRRAHARLAPCPCGSGKRYKHCHGKLP